MSLPVASAPEIAIAGRSNVGKSTLLNRLAGRKGLARTSKTPGRTRGLVMFALRFRREWSRRDAPPVDELRLIDLPGYGYAQVSRAERRAWQPLIEGYTRTRRALALFVILIDARRGIEDEERQLYEWLGTEHVPAQIVFTKVDKLTGQRARRAARAGAGCRSAAAAARAGRCSSRARRARGWTRCGRRSSTPSGAPGPAAAELAEGPAARLASSGRDRWRSTSCQRPSTSSRCGSPTSTP